jgi:hypothetical protein
MHSRGGRETVSARDFNGMSGCRLGIGNNDYVPDTNGTRALDDLASVSVKARVAEMTVCVDQH